MATKSKKDPKQEFNDFCGASVLMIVIIWFLVKFTKVEYAYLPMFMLCCSLYYAYESYCKIGKNEE